MRLYLPRAAGEAAEAAPASLAESRRHAGATILVVEDDADIRSLAATLLRSLGYEVLAASDPQEALRLVADDLSP